MKLLFVLKKMSCVTGAKSVSITPACEVLPLSEDQMKQGDTAAVSHGKGTVLTSDNTSSGGDAARISELHNGIEVEASTREHMDFFVGLMNDISGIPEMKTILDNIEKDKVSVKTVDSLPGYQVALTVRKRHLINGKFSHYTWEIRVTPDCPNGGLLEEFFHVYQYHNTSDWLKGDLEFEAKIFDAIMYHKYSVLKFDNRIPQFSGYLAKFLEKPCRDRYLQVLGYLNRDGYPLTVFPLSDMPYEYRIININNLVKLTTISNEHL